MTFPRRRLSAKGREALYELERQKAVDAGRGEFPICNLCGFFVTRSHLWDESHDPAKPHAWGGTEVGIAHRRCNRLHAAKVVTPMVAKAKRQWRSDVGITGDGLGDSPLPGGRDDRLKRTMRGKTVLRATGEKWRPGR